MKTPPRSALLLVAAAGAVAGIAVMTNRAYPVSQWLLWRVLGYWALALYFGAGCLAAGTAIVVRVSPRRYRPDEVLAIGFPLGVLAFSIAVFLAGLARRLHTPFFALAPLGFLVAGYPTALPVVKRLVRSARAPGAWRPSPLELASVAFGLFGLVVTYLPILTPHNIQHDARWYHLPIAQQYASTGGIERFQEGWFLGAYPHLTSLLYTWAMLLPAGIVHRLALCAHVEFLIVVATLLALPAVVRRLVPGLRVPTAWTGFFLFPSFLAYDSNVSLGADHVAALWAPAGFLALYRALRTLEVRDSAIVGALAAGAASTKYSALSIVAPLMGAVLVRAWLHGRKRGYGPRALHGPYAMLGAFFACWAPHWARNLAWYGDPLYPHLHAYFHPHPWDAQAEVYLRVFMEYAVLRPTRDLSGVVDSLLAVLTLGFRVNEPFGWRGDLPLFGFLFAATLYATPFARAGRRVWIAQALSVAAVLVWYWTNHRDRYLQACLPWLVACTVAVLAVMWQRGDRVSRAAAALLVAGELFMGAGIWLLPLHVMVPGRHPLPKVIDLVQEGYDKHYAERFQPFPDWNFADWVAVGRSVPRGSRVLVHEDRLWLGLDAPVVVDEAQWQAGIRYLTCSTPASVYDVLRPYGISYAVTGKSHGDGGGHGIAGDLAFYNFLFSSAKRVTTKGKLTLWRLPAERPATVEPGSVLVITCNQSLAPGLYAFPGVLQGRPDVTLPEKAEIADSIIERAAFVVVETSCGFGLDVEKQLGAFESMTNRRGVEYLRRKPE